jgi:zinc protease
MGQDSIFYQAMLLGQFETVASWRLLESYVANVRSVTAQDVMRVAREYFTENNRTVGILIPVKPDAGQTGSSGAKRPDGARH